MRWRFHSRESAQDFADKIVAEIERIGAGARVPLRKARPPSKERPEAMPLIEIPKDARKGLPPCGECHLSEGETCDICGATAAVKQTIFIDAAAKRSDLPDCGGTDGLCPTCGGVLETGFGLAGGGYGVYEYCGNENCYKVVTKTDVED